MSGASLPDPPGPGLRTLASLLDAAERAERFAAPAADLLIRIFLAQLLSRDAIAALLDWPARLAAIAPVAHWGAMSPEHAAVVQNASEFLLPLLLLLGLFTRPAGAAVLLGGLAALRMHPGQDSGLIPIGLGAWFIAAGAGPLSLDARIARGLATSALPLAPAALRALQRFTAFAQPVALLAIRLGAAWLLVQGRLPEPARMAGAALLALGSATRPTALALLAVSAGAAMMAGAGPTSGWALLLCLLAAFGPGPLSADALAGLALRAPRRRFEAWRRARLATLPHVVIVGGGFGGLAVARGLRAAPCRITLVDQRNYHLFQPLLYQVATAGLSPADIATPIRNLLRDQFNVTVRLARVVGVDTAARRVQLEDGGSLAYDRLVLATGARHAYFGHDAWAPFAPGLKTIEDATDIRSRLLLAFERAEAETDPEKQRAQLTFAVVGGGPTGVELAGAIAELARHGLAGEFRAIDPASARVLLLQAGERLLPAFAPVLSQRAADALRGLGVEVRLEARVMSVSAAGLALADETIACGTVFWAAGVAASAAGAWLGAACDRAGRLQVDARFAVPGMADVFAIGDTAACASPDGTLVPGLAPAAKQGGAYVARRIAAGLTGRPEPGPFQYRHEGDLATIGRRAAVVDFGRLRFTGAAAWWVWGLAHVLFLAGVRNRSAVAVQWFWAYLTYGRGIRLITGTAPGRG